MKKAAKVIDLGPYRARNSDLRALLVVQTELFTHV